MAGLEQAILATAQSRLDKAVAAGKLTSPEEQVLLGRVNSRLGQLVNVSHPGKLVRRALRRAAFARFSAGYLGITPAQLRSDLGSGSTLAQIAVANGKTVCGPRAGGRERGHDTARPGGGGGADHLAA